MRFAVPTTATTSFQVLATPSGLVATVDENADDGAVLATVVVSYDRAGGFRWREDFGAPIVPLMQADGTVWVAQSYPAPVLTRLNESGRRIATYDIASADGSNLWPLGFDDDGRLVLGLSDYRGGSTEVVLWDPCDGERWRVELPEGLVGPVALDADGRLYIGAGQSVHVFGPDGERVAMHEIGTFLNGAPQRVSSGEIIVTSVSGPGIDDTTSDTRVVAMLGATSRDFLIPGRWSPGRSPVGDLPNNILGVRTWDHIVAVDLITGLERWRYPIHPNLHFDLVGDENGRFLLLSQSLTTFDGETGERIWSTDPPSSTQCAHGLAYDTDVIAASQCDGTLLALEW